MSPYGNDRCFVVVKGFRRTALSQGHNTALCAALNQQIAIGSHVLFHSKDKNSNLGHIVAWKEMQPLWAQSKQFPTRAQPDNFYSNRTFSEMSSLLQCFEFLVSQLQVKTQVTTLQTTQVEQIHYELGDHADDAIAAESAKRRVTVPFDEVFDDCGDDTTAIDLPEADAETAHFVHAYSDASSEPCSSDDAASACDSVFFIS